MDFKLTNIQLCANTDESSDCIYTEFETHLIELLLLFGQGNRCDTQLNGIPRSMELRSGGHHSSELNTSHLMERFANVKTDSCQVFATDPIVGSCCCKNVPV
jgi:hypothetical protein